MRKLEREVNMSRIVAGLAPIMFLVSGVVAAQSAPPRKDIPAIAKAANGSIVSIVMSDKDGKPVAQGSGFFVSKDGLVVTNYHVISEGSSAVVKLPDGAFYSVDGVHSSDKARDIAVIKAHGQNFLTLPLGNSDRVQVGDEVVAIGNPLSLESTVSNGIVSGVRTIKEKGGKFLQVTAPISPGSSGGPLFNMAGEVIGITTMRLEGGENLNFAIPVNNIKPLLSNKSATLQDFPNAEGGREKSNEESGRERSKEPVPYRVVAYDPSAQIVSLRSGSFLIVARVTSAEDCLKKNPETDEYTGEPKCRDVLPTSIASRLVGEDIAVCLTLECKCKDGYRLLSDGKFYHLSEFHKSWNRYAPYRVELWEVDHFEKFDPKPARIRCSSSNLMTLDAALNEGKWGQPQGKEELGKVFDIWQTWCGPTFSKADRNIKTLVNAILQKCGSSRVTLACVNSAALDVESDLEWDEPRK